MNRKFVKKIDIIALGVIAAIGLVGLLLYFTRSPSGKSAEVYVDSRLAYIVDLDQGELSFSVPQRPSITFRVYEDGGIAFESSDCPDKVCVNTGRLTHSGQSAACLPNATVLKVVKRGDAPDLDM